jgi:hypothetical protein
MWAANKAAKTTVTTSRTDRESDARIEWFRRFEEMLDLVLSPEDTRSQVGSRLLEQHVTSTLAGIEEKQLALAVLAQIMESPLKQFGVNDPAAVEEPAMPGQSETRFVGDRELFRLDPGQQDGLSHDPRGVPKPLQQRGNRS